MFLVITQGVRVRLSHTVPPLVLKWLIIHDLLVGVLVVHQVDTTNAPSLLRGVTALLLVMTVHTARGHQPVDVLLQDPLSPVVQYPRPLIAILIDHHHHYLVNAVLFDVAQVNPLEQYQAASRGERGACLPALPDCPLGLWNTGKDLLLL